MDYSKHHHDPKECTDEDCQVGCDEAARKTQCYCREARGLNIITVEHKWNIRDRWWDVVISDGHWMREYRCKGPPENNTPMQPKLDAFKEDFELARIRMHRTGDVSLEIKGEG